jgi:hypothetical protein
MVRSSSRIRLPSSSCAGPAGSFEPEVDDWRSLDDGVVAEDDDQLCVADRRERQAERVERGADVLGHDRAVSLQALSEEFRQGVGLLDGLGAGQRGDDVLACRPEHGLGLSKRVIPGQGLVPAATREPAGVDDPVACTEVREPEPALVAEPALVDLGMVPRDDALDLSLASRGFDVAAHRAEPADRRHVLDLPGPRFEPVLRRRERAHRTELDHVSGERRTVGLVLERGDDRLRSSLAGDELTVLGDVGREARAAVAEDAAFAVEGDRRRDRDRLLEGPLREGVTRHRRAPAERQVLERALAAFVADRAVERMVDEDELEGRVLPVGGRLRGLGGADDHSVRRRQGAAGLELRHALDLDEAHAAGADRRSETWLVTEDGNLDPGRERRLHEPGPLRHLHFAPVDRDGDDLRRAQSRTSSGPWGNLPVPPDPVHSSALRADRPLRGRLMLGPRRPENACAGRSGRRRLRSRTRRRTGTRPRRCAPRTRRGTRRCSS